MYPHSRWNHQLLVGEFRCHQLLWFYCIHCHLAAAVIQKRQDLCWAICHPIKNTVKVLLWSLVLFWGFFSRWIPILLSGTALGTLEGAQSFIRQWTASAPFAADWEKIAWWNVDRVWQGAVRWNRILPVDSLCGCAKQWETNLVESC